MIRKTTLLLLALAALLGTAAFTLAPGSSVGEARPDDRRDAAWPFHGDRPLRRGLVAITAQETGLRPREVVDRLRDGQSLAEIAEEAGSSREAILARFGETVERRFDRAAEDQRLPADVAGMRAAWYQGAAEKMVGQPGLSPAYPGLHELHVVAITAATRLSDLPRATIRDELRDCRTLDEILTGAGHSGQAAVDAAMTVLDEKLDGLVAAGKLSEAQRTSWGEGIEAALGTMVITPGVHVAGKECAG